MSRSSPQLTNPASHFYEWRSGKLVWYDKEAQKTNEVKLPFSFLVLDELHTITGYSDADESGFWSNETRSTKDEFTVRTKKGTRYVGAYKNDQYIVQVPQGARYTKSVYIAEKSGAGYVISNLKLTGAALTAWIEFAGKHKVQNGKVLLTGSTEGKKGATTYHIPTFEYTSATPAEDEAAIALDKDLQVYLSQYLAAAKVDHEEEVSHDAIDPELGKATPAEIADFEKRKSAKFENLKAEDFEDDKPDENQETYNRQAVDEVFFDEPLPDLPPELRG